MGFTSEVELQISNVPTPDIANVGERKTKDAERLRKIAALISKATQVRITQLVRPKIDRDRFDRYKVVFSVNEEDVTRVIQLLDGIKLKPTDTIIHVSRTGHMVRALGEDAQEAVESKVEVEA